MKKLMFGEHALFQMQERNISKSLVQKAFINPGVIVPARKGRHKLVYRIHKNLCLVVFFREVKNHIHVITTYYTSIK